jgi:hypothetical protein
VRVKIPQGLLDAEQLRALAEVAVYWSRGFGHVTTRQNVQFHFVRPRDVPQLLAHLGRVGLTTREACGNSVRNITACLAADLERSRATTTRRHWRVPAPQVQIAFEGCASRDHARPGSTTSGSGAAARRRAEPTRGFQVVAGGAVGATAWSCSISPRSSC